MIITLQTEQHAQEVRQHLDFNKSFNEIGIIISLSTQLSDKTEFAAICIKSAISGDVPCKKIISTVKDMIVDNYDAMCNILGLSLTEKILAS